MASSPMGMRRSSRLAPLKSPESKMKTICAWCTKVMSPGQMPVTHGICRSCATVYLDVHRDVVDPMPGCTVQA